jgi:hypothetical protein
LRIPPIEDWRFDVVGYQIDRSNSTALGLVSKEALAVPAGTIKYEGEKKKRKKYRHEPRREA